MKTIADAIDRAINKHLWDGVNSSAGTEKAISASGAVLFSCYSNGCMAYQEFKFMKSLGGMPTDSHQFDEVEFDQIPFGEKRQYARALWLTWASMIAREEEI